VQTGTAAILAWIAALIFWNGSFPISFSTQSLFAIIFTGTIATALILAVQTFIQKMTSPTNVAIIFAMEPVFGALFAIAFGNEYLNPIQWVGSGLILMSMVGQQIIDLHFQKSVTEAQKNDEVIPNEKNCFSEKKKREK
jgi:drug/metabolite transporter (DMT)-like permease